VDPEEFVGIELCDESGKRIPDEMHLAPRVNFNVVACGRDSLDIVN
jgi:hypothetical protein